MVLEGGPSAKYQVRLVTLPVERSVKVTVRGLAPLMGLTFHAAWGSSAPVPTTVLVELPPLAVTNTTELVKVAPLVGLKDSSKLVVPNPGRLNPDAKAETMEKGPLLNER